MAATLSYISTVKRWMWRAAHCTWQSCSQLYWHQPTFVHDEYSNYQGLIFNAYNIYCEVSFSLRGSSCWVFGMRWAQWVKWSWLIKQKRGYLVTCAPCTDSNQSTTIQWTVVVGSGLVRNFLQRIGSSSKYRCNRWTLGIVFRWLIDLGTLDGWGGASPFHWQYLLWNPLSYVSIYKWLLSYSIIVEAV